MQLNLRIIAMIQASTYQVQFQNEGYQALNELIASKDYSTIFLLVDSNTFEHCYPRFVPHLESNIRLEVIEIDPGETFKNLETCQGVWEAMTELGADRKSLLITLGGGVVTDLGGFVAGAFKRGIDFVNIPTTLLSMVDASVGGKTGVDLGVLKNQIGMFINPELVIVDVDYLDTLLPREVLSGLAEIIKYGLTFDIKLLDELKYPNSFKNNQLINDSIAIKNKVVLQDPKEQNIRKVLNFGHTVGHAIESYFLQDTTKESLTHGEAIAIGMVCESYLSSKLCGLPVEKAQMVKDYIADLYPSVHIGKDDIVAILEYLKHDKKNTKGTVNFVLLSDFETYVLDCQASNEQITESIEFYLN